MKKTSYLNSLFSNPVLQHFVHGNTCTRVIHTGRQRLWITALKPQKSLKNLRCVYYIPTGKINIRIISVTMTWASLFSIMRLKRLNPIEIIWHFCDIQIQQIHRCNVWWTSLPCGKVSLIQTTKAKYAIYEPRSCWTNR